MKINMYAVRVRLVSDVKGLLEDKPGRVVVTLALDHEGALALAKARYKDLENAGVSIEYLYPTQLADTIALEALVHSGAS